MKTCPTAIVIACVVLVNPCFAKQSQADQSKDLIQEKLVQQDSLPVPRAATEILEGTTVQQGDSESLSVGEFFETESRKGRRLEPGQSTESESIRRDSDPEMVQRGIAKDEPLLDLGVTKATATWDNRLLEQSYYRAQGQSPHALQHSTIRQTEASELQPTVGEVLAGKTAGALLPETASKSRTTRTADRVSSSTPSRKSAFLLFLPLLIAPVVFYLFYRFFGRSNLEEWEWNAEADQPAVFLDSFAMNERRDSGFSSFATEKIVADESTQNIAKEGLIDFAGSQSSIETRYEVSTVSERDLAVQELHSDDSVEVRENAELTRASQSGREPAVESGSTQSQSSDELAAKIASGLAAINECEGDECEAEIGLARPEEDPVSLGCEETTNGDAEAAKEDDRKESSETAASRPGSEVQQRQPPEAEDLTRINGIGPATSSLLNKAGIRNYQELSRATLDDLQAIVAGGGTKFKLIDPSTWAMQAKFAMQDDWSGLTNWLEASRQRRKANGLPARPERQKVSASQLSSDGKDREDDLTLIRGIGPATRKLLKEKGICTFQQLSMMTGMQLIDLLHSVDASFALKDPQTWPEQARELLASTGAEMEQEVLKQIQDLSNEARNASEKTESGSSARRQNQEA
jgi:predicted flap endonuclease-1-like 5' DNA nuclease